MSLRKVYERFLASPNPLSLSDSAALHYVTTRTSYTQQGPIVRHLESQNKNVVRKKAEKIISAVEGHSSIALEVETTLEFLSSGGSYLPGLDNFIVDRTVILPVTHFVYFDKDEKISQIRLNWDQGSLLKQVEVIGKSGRNWPITDGADQIRIVKSSATSGASNALPASRGRTDEHSEPSHRNPSPSKKYIKDPHASLDVFEPPKDDENRRPSTAESNSVAPRESAKPPPREYNELFAAGHEDFAPSPNGSPSKAHSQNAVAPKGAGARRFQDSNLFQENQEFRERKIYKTNPARYNHFDLGDPIEDDSFQHRPKSQQTQQDASSVARAKNMSQWDFEDFSMTEKHAPRYRESDQVNFSFEDQDNQVTPGKPKQSQSRKQAESHFEFLDDGTPVQRLPAQAKARKDAELHFEFRDEPTPAPRRIIARTKAAAGLYANPLEDDLDDEDNRKAPLSSITNNAGRKKNFESHWDAADESPSQANDSGKSVGTTRMKAVRSMGADWDDYDQPAEGAKKPVGAKARNPLKSTWSFQDE